MSLEFEPPSTGVGKANEWEMKSAEWSGDFGGLGVARGEIVGDHTGVEVGSVSGAGHFWFVRSFH